MSIKIITISRQFGSGGRTIAKKLAEKLGYDYYDKEIIENVALKSGLSPEYIASHGEDAPGTTAFAYGFESQGVPGVMEGMSASDYLWCIQSRVIKEIADKENPCIIVGRNADYVLRERDDVMNVFIYADLEFRKDRIVRLYGESEKKPEKRLADKDKKRAVNYKHYTDRQWGDMVNYDICMNSGKIGIDNCVDELCSIIEKNK